jgi:hypothetical protein
VIVTCASGSSCSYAHQSITENAAKANPAPSTHVLFEPDAAKTVTIYGIQSGTGSGGQGSDGADHLTLQDFRMPYDGSHDCDIYLAPDTQDVLINHVDICSVQENDVNYVTVQDSDLGPCPTGGSACTQNRYEGDLPYGNHLSWIGNYIHDYTRTGSSQHYECLAIWAAQNYLTISGNKFVNCAVFDILMEGPSSSGLYDNVLLENNWFDRPRDLGTSPAPSGQYAVDTNGCYTNFTARNNSFGSGTKIGWRNAACVTNGAEIGDVSGMFDCRSGVTSSYNVGGEACPGTGNVIASLSNIYVNGSDLGSGGDFHLKAPPDLALDHVPIASCAAVDIDGNPRTGSFCNAGADDG